MIGILITQPHSHHFSVLINVEGVYRKHPSVLDFVAFLFCSCKGENASLWDFFFIGHERERNNGGIERKSWGSRVLYSCGQQCSGLVCWCQLCVTLILVSFLEVIRHSKFSISH